MAGKIVDELFNKLATTCELEDEIVNALRPGFLEVVEKHLSPPTEVQSGEGKTRTRKTATKRATSPKSDKIPHKNAYHFFVAAKMVEVKDSVAAKDRMKHIGELWKKISDDERKTFVDKADSYNVSVDEAMKSSDWSSKREGIVETANKATAEAPVEAPVEVPVEAPSTAVDVPVEETKVPEVSEAPVTPAPVKSRTSRSKAPKTK